MKNLTETIEILKSIMSYHTGANPTFEVDLENDKIYIVDSCSSFLKHLYTNEKICASLHDGKIQVQFFTQEINK